MGETEHTVDKLVDRLGGHLRIRHSGTTRYLDYIADYDNTNTQVIEFGSNLLDYSETHSHTFTAKGTLSSTGTGNGQNLPPYITCYMWKRIA